MERDKPARRAFKACPIGFFHIDIAEIRTAEGKLRLFVAIDRTSKLAFVQLVESATRVMASAFLAALIEAVPCRVHMVLTDNGIQFYFPPRHANGPTASLIIHMFDMRCRENGIEHRLTKPNHPWTNGQVERMNRTIKDATVKRDHYDDHDPLRRHLLLFIDAYEPRAQAQDPARPHAGAIHLEAVAGKSRFISPRTVPLDPGTIQLAAPLCNG